MAICLLEYSVQYQMKRYNSKITQRFKAARLLTSIIVLKFYRHCCWGARQIYERSGCSRYKSREFEALRYHKIRNLCGKQNRAHHVKVRSHIRGRGAEAEREQNQLRNKWVQHPIFRVRFGTARSKPPLSSRNGRSAASAPRMCEQTRGSGAGMSKSALSAPQPLRSYVNVALLVSVGNEPMQLVVESTTLFVLLFGSNCGIT